VTGPAYIPQAQREDWRTPPEVVTLVAQVFGGQIDLDPCASVEGLPLAAENWSVELGHDGLTKPWAGTVYVNPPFGTLRAWAEKCAAEAATGAEVILLMPARTDTRAWHQHVSTASAVVLWRGRLTFVGAPSVAPFPVALVYWGPRIQRFREVFGAHGMVFRP
jgi:hypothetical protein